MPVVAPPVAAIAEHRLIDRLLRARAFSTATAVPLADLSFVEQRRLEQLCEFGVVIQAGSGAYYLDGPGLADHWYGRHRRLRVAVAVVAILLGALLAIATVLQR